MQATTKKGKYKSVRYLLAAKTPLGLMFTVVPTSVQLFISSEKTIYN